MHPSPPGSTPQTLSSRRPAATHAAIVAVATATLLAFLVLFSAAQANAQTAAVAATTANLNQRAGPGTPYPVLQVVPAGAQLTLYGCVGGHTWCDGVYAGTRGWFSSTYLRVWHQGQYMPVAQYAAIISFPVVAFNLEAYWGRYYPTQPFYPDRARWVSPAPSQGVQVGQFYNRLAPHGRWVWINGQYVWTPIVNADWRPYTDGRWVYNRRHGWTWVSNEPFGWATYHYGRWGYSHRIGWFWVPGTRWAPAWVSWRYSGNTIAWAPMPPDPNDSFSFGVSYGNIPNYYWQPVPANLFLSINLNFNIIRDEQQKALVLADTQEAGGVTEDDNVVVNQVLPVELVEEATQEEVVPVELALTDDPEATEVEDGTVQIFLPPEEEVVATEPEDVETIETVEAESTTAGQAPADEADTEDQVPPPPAPDEVPPVSELPVTTDEIGQDAAPVEAIEPDAVVCPEGTVLDENGECVPATALPPPPLEEDPVTLPAEEGAPPPPPPADEPPPPPAATEEPTPPVTEEEEQPAPPVVEPPPAPPAEEPPPPPPPAEEPPPPPPPAQEPPPPPVVEEPAPPPAVPAPQCPEGLVLLPDGTCALPEE